MALTKNDLKSLNYIERSNKMNTQIPIPDVIAIAKVNNIYYVSRINDSDDLLMEFSDISVIHYLLTEFDLLSEGYQLYEHAIIAAEAINADYPSGGGIKYFGSYKMSLEHKLDR